MTGDGGQVIQKELSRRDLLKVVGSLFGAIVVPEKFRNLTTGIVNPYMELVESVNYPSEKLTLIDWINNYWTKIEPYPFPVGKSTNSRSSVPEVTDFKFFYLYDNVDKPGAARVVFTATAADQSTPEEVFTFPFDNISGKFVTRIPNKLDNTDDKRELLPFRMPIIGVDSYMKGSVLSIDERGNFVRRRISDGQIVARLNVNGVFA